MDHRRASTTELIDALCEQERHPDLKLIQALLERGNEVVPELIEVVECDTDWPQVHAALLLCELQAESALPALRRAISMPERHGLADWLADDALEKFGSAALDMLEAVAADKTVEWYPRAVACRGLSLLREMQWTKRDCATCFGKRRQTATTKRSDYGASSTPWLKGV